VGEEQLSAQKVQMLFFIVTIKMFFTPPNTESSILISCIVCIHIFLEYFNDEPIVACTQIHSSYIQLLFDIFFFLGFAIENTLGSVCNCNNSQ
jgi:hypothetical protein